MVYYFEDEAFSFLNLSFALLATATTAFLPITLARCSITVKICIFLAKDLPDLLTLLTVASASFTVPNLIGTVSFDSRRCIAYDQTL